MIEKASAVAKSGNPAEPEGVFRVTKVNA